MQAGSPRTVVIHRPRMLSLCPTALHAEVSNKQAVGMEGLPSP
jgi:hypothetical protein